MSDYACRPATDADRPFLEWMYALTETWGDDTRPLPGNYFGTRIRYVGGWEPDQGGVVLELRGDGDEPEEAEEILAASEQGAPFGVEDGALPVGAAWLRTFPQDDPGAGWYRNGWPEMAIALRPGLHGQGLSSVLLEGLLADARRRGYPGVTLAVEHGNDRAARAYEKAGFRHVGPSHRPKHDVMVFPFD
ncbi:N-acetyltransferase family protein [Corynebacterium sp. 335C]